MISFRIDWFDFLANSEEEFFILFWEAMRSFDEPLWLLERNNLKEKENRVSVEMALSSV